MNVRQVVPFLRVSDMERSLRYYVDGLGFVMKNRWVDEGKLRWCWLELEGAALMLQESSQLAATKVGEGVSLCFICGDALALYRTFTARGVACSEPEVGNAMWVTGTSDPDGYRLEFESATEVAENTKLSDL